MWGSPTSPSSRRAPTRQKTNSTVIRNLAKSSRQVPKAQDQLHSTPLGWGEEGLAGIWPSPLCSALPTPGPRSCGPQMWGGQRYDEKLYSTCASPVVPHPSTGHAHGCLASEIGRDPAFPTRFDRTVASLEVSLLAPSRLGRDCDRCLEETCI